GTQVTNPGQIQFTVYFGNWPTNESLTLSWEGTLLQTWLAGQHAGTFVSVYSISIPQQNATYTVTTISGSGATDSQIFTVPCLGPDLLVVGPLQLISTPPIIAYQPVQFNVLIANASDINIIGQFFVDIYLDPNPDLVLTTTIPITESDGYTAVSFLAGGETRLLMVTAYLGFANPTPHVVYGFVDSDEHIDETDETNNITGPLMGIQVTPAAPTPTTASGRGTISGSTFVLGELRAGVYVNLIDESDGRTMALTVTDQFGYFRFSEVPAGTKYTVTGCIIIEGEAWHGWLSGIAPPNTAAHIILIQQPCS
ncbi:MAG TPA: CARDB domain-containing protein, partial [Chloroflexota bacterium]|nr:CARDB domain-containing protein [Chloroflexota bacterium]